MPKLTFSLDELTVARLKRLAKRTRKPQSLIVREAIAGYGAKTPAYSPEEIAARVRRFDELMAEIPKRSAHDMTAELTEVRRARRQASRRRPL